MGELVRGVEVVFIHSAHGAELAAWYRDTLGLGELHADGHWFELDAGGGARFAVDATGFPRSEVEAQAVMFALTVEDIEAAVAQLAADGVAFYPDAERAVFDVGPARVATFRDPDGNWVQLAERAPREG